MSPHATIIDERWLAEWIDFGLRECQTYLAKHARFERYCAERASRTATHERG